MGEAATCSGSGPGGLGMTASAFPIHIVMAGLVPAIHALLADSPQ